MQDIILNYKQNRREIVFKREFKHNLKFVETLSLPDVSSQTITRASSIYSQTPRVGVCGPLLKTLILFMTKLCHFPYPIYDLKK